MASLTTAMSVGEPRPDRNNTQDTILLYKPRHKVKFNESIDNLQCTRKHWGDEIVSLLAYYTLG